MTTLVCQDCGQAPWLTATSAPRRGYQFFPDGSKICFACELARAKTRTRQPHVLPGGKITNRAKKFRGSSLPSRETESPK